MILLSRLLRTFCHQVNHSQIPLIGIRKKVRIRKERTARPVEKFFQVVEEEVMIVAVMRNLIEGTYGALSFDERSR